MTSSWLIHRSPVDSPTRGQWCWALIFSWIFIRTNGWTKSRVADDLRPYEYSSDVIPHRWFLGAIANNNQIREIWSLDYYGISMLKSMLHYYDVIMGTNASQITSLAVVYSTVYSGADQRKQSSASLAFVWGIHRRPVNSPHKWPVTRKILPFDDVIMN